MNLPNRITVLRMALAPLLAALLLMDGPMWQIWSTVVFMTASLTDLIDGRIARSRNLITDFGKFMDPIADKLLVMVALIALCSQARLDAWIAMVLLGREFVISGIRLVASGKGVVIAADTLAKYKTAAQMIALPGLMLSTGADAVFPWLLIPSQVALYLSVALSVASLVQYISRNKEIFANDL